MRNKYLLTMSLGAFVLLAAQAFSQQQDNLDYDEGVGLITGQQWDSAQAFFTEFQSNWPESAWADDAAFWNCYALEQAGTEDDQHFNCYQQFISSWSNSSWVSDARSKLAVLGSRLADRGFPGYLQRTFDDFDFDIDIDEDEISESVERAMEIAERELERVRAGNIRIPRIPSVNIRNIQRDVRVAVDRRVNVSRGSSRRNARPSADDELLAIISALRDDERASEILLRRLESSDNADFRNRIVILLEDMPGENITSALINVIDNDESEEVRNSAILVLLDREDESSLDLLRSIATNPEYPVSIRKEILGELEDWGPELAVTTLTSILETETDPTMVAEAADALSDMGTPEALSALMRAYENIESLVLRHEILEEIADVETDEVISFLTQIALSDIDDETAAIAIDGISDREDNIAVTALDQIYASSSSIQRRLAILDGIGDAENELAVEVLQQLLVDETNSQIVAAILRALGSTEQESAVAPVIDAYRASDDETVRRGALRALRRLDDYPAATDAMLEILEAELDARANQ